MPFHGIRADRRYLFSPEPITNIGVNDTNTWRLNPDHRHVYNKLHIALSQGLIAAPSGVSPLAMQLSPEQACFVKPITNLGGMSLNSFASTAQKIADASINSAENNNENCAAGSFWCEFLEGSQTSTDILILNGQPKWYGHTKAADEKNKNRPIYWKLGYNCQQLEPLIESFIHRELKGYTGLCNVEMIGDFIIEAHLRGSNAFFDYYPKQFIQTWVNVVDLKQWTTITPLKQGCVYSMFGGWSLNDGSEQLVESLGAKLYRDGMIEDRVAILFTDTVEQAKSIEMLLKAKTSAI
ncbi:hypothetical protein [Leucothrix arctica]|uniref:Uncharacterized protein n=1 Tax=Leucothrix arctica TaxID=1481894 RepID=A0A317CLV7_9GAMM|nr:hypothetical protein [Leucothrix arctica]PWQ97280.1 hypothetical protein DKT75_07005 [Leucothrix arctica]